MASMESELARHGSLPILGSVSDGSGASDLTGDRRLPPLPRVDPLPRGPFSPFTPNTLTNPPSPQSPFPGRSSCQPYGQIVTPPSPPSNADSSCTGAFSWQTSTASPDRLSPSEIMSLVAPRNLNRKPPLQQQCGLKRKSSMCNDHDEQREKHRIAEGNRRKNLSQLHRELDTRLHDYFLMQAGWNPARNLPQSKEHIVQAAVYLIDFMHAIIFHLMHQEGEAPDRLHEKSQPQVRGLQLQQIVSNLQQQNQYNRQQSQAPTPERQIIEERSRTLDRQLKSYDPIFRTPKSEASSPQPLSAVPETKPTEIPLPGVRALCDDIDTVSPKSAPRDSRVGSSQSLSRSSANAHPPMAGAPPSLSFPPSSFAPPASWR